MSLPSSFIIPTFLNDVDVFFLDREKSTELNDLFSRSSRAKVSARLELERNQICTTSTKLKPCPFFGVTRRDNAMTDNADVREIISNNPLLDY